MSKYEYISWQKHLLSKVDKEPTKEMIDEIVENVRNPKINDFLAHQLHEVQNALFSGASDYRWSDLERCAEEAKRVYLSDDVSLFPMSFMNLGKAVEAFEHPTRDEHLEMSIALAEKLTKGLPFKHKELQLQCLKDIAQDMAENKWEGDKDKEIRLDDMSQEVYVDLYVVAKENDLLKYFPETSTIKSWLRKIAPEYASKAGRPKKIEK